MNPIRSFHTFFCTRLKQGYFILLKTMRASMHHKLSIIHNNLLRIHQSTSFRFVESITFSLSFKVFELCNLCFQMHHFFVTKADRITERETLGLKSD
ncbi:hypothetical protein WP3W18E06_18410 [Raoultella ornithinolytica]|nr:hypothetical protein WP3W18E06_18410 [Raoultella ornithinolytica]